MLKLTGSEDFTSIEVNGMSFSAPQAAVDEIERMQGNFLKAVAAMGACLDCLEQNADDPDTVAIGILREALYGTPHSRDEKIAMSPIRDKETGE